MSDNDVRGNTREIAECADELVALVYRYLPQRVYRSEPRSRIVAAAALVRMCETVEAIMSQMEARRDVEANVLLRSLFEQAVTFMWFAIDPEPRFLRWFGEADVEQLKLHNDVSTFDMAFLSDAEIERCKNAEGMPPLAERAREVDEMLSRDVRGMHPPKHALSVRGQYATIYRLTSRATHASIIPLDQIYVTPGPSGLRIVDRPGPEKQSTMTYGLVSPMVTQALLVAAGRFFNWLDEDKIRAINERAVIAWERARTDAERD